MRKSGKHASHFLAGASSPRRTFLRDTGVGLLAFVAGGREWLLTPAEARAADLPLRVLAAPQVRTLEAFGETLVPGSAAAGLVHFIDYQLAAPPGEQMLMIRYLGVEAPYTPFYAGGLQALDAAASALHGAPFHGLEDGQRVALTRQLAQANPKGWPDGGPDSGPDRWTAPPAPLFYFVLRSDAVDVVYGTKEGVERLGLSYMAHIEPPSRWGE
jgi:hypothetical protein